MEFRVFKGGGDMMMKETNKKSGNIKERERER